MTKKRLSVFLGQDVLVVFMSGDGTQGYLYLLDNGWFVVENDVYGSKTFFESDVVERVVVPK